MAEDLQIKREIVLGADAETLERMRKEGHGRGFAVFCDEGERIGKPTAVRSEYWLNGSAFDPDSFKTKSANLNEGDGNGR